MREDNGKDLGNGAQKFSQCIENEKESGCKSFGWALSRECAGMTLNSLKGVWHAHRQQLR